MITLLVFVALVALVALVTHVAGVLLTVAESLPKQYHKISTLESRIIG